MDSICLLSQAQGLERPVFAARWPVRGVRKAGIYLFRRLSCYYYRTWNSHSMESQSTSLNRCTPTIARHHIHTDNEIPSSPSMFDNYDISSDKMVDNRSKGRWSSEILKLRFRKGQHKFLKGFRTSQLNLGEKQSDSECQISNIKGRWSSEILKLRFRKAQHKFLKGFRTGQLNLRAKQSDSECQVSNINGIEIDYENTPVAESGNECVVNNIHSSFGSFVVESQVQLESSKTLSHQLETQSDNREVQINLVPESCNNIIQKKRRSNETSVERLEASKRLGQNLQTTEEEIQSDNRETQINLVPESCNNIIQKKRRSNENSVNSLEASERTGKHSLTTVKEPNKAKLACIYDKVLVVNNISTAKEVVRILTSKYRNLIYACDTEVANIDVKRQTPVGHGDIICFSIYSGEEADFGNGKSCIWVDVLDDGKSLLMEFLPFFNDSSIKKVWHNYSFDSHVLENYGVKLSGFHADTMHLARLWDSSRRADCGYSLEALTSDTKVMSGLKTRQNDISGVADELIIGKVSMKSIFSKKKLKKDGSEGKVITLAPVEVLQREERKLWISYSSLYSISTKKLFNSLKQHLEKVDWILDGEKEGTMYDFYEKYWRPFGDLLEENGI